MENEIRQLKTKVVLVDDNKLEVYEIARAFADLNLNDCLVIMNNVEEAFDYLKSDKNEKTCIVLLNIEMSKMKGMEFLKKIKGDEILKLIPVIVQTESKEYKDKLEIFKWNVAGYFIKPFNHLRFIKVLGAYWSFSELPSIEKRITNNFKLQNSI